LISKDFEKFNHNYPSVITVGTFDGIHLGHQQLIKKVIEVSKAEQSKSIILTFDPHPRSVLENSKNISLLNTFQEKENILIPFGLDFLVKKKFTEEFSKMSSIDFVKNILIDKLNLKHLVIGHDHHFGRNRTANITQLMEYSKQYDFKVTQVDAFKLNGISVSSTKIRNLIKEGNIDEANRFLGYNMFLSGTVVAGKGRGKKMGFPTANILLEKLKIKPGNGVYLISSMYAGIKIYGMMNIGNNPTFDDKSPSIEVHFFDFDQKIYDENIHMQIITRIRNEIKFSGSDELSNQLIEDKKKCIEFISRNKKSP
jgi:riboflavin kinase/FMN adenylyltransferase